MRTLAFLAVLLACAVIAGPASAAGRCGNHPWCNTGLSPDERAGLLAQELTLEEKIDLMAGDDPSTGLAATWDVAIARRYGAVVGNEVKLKGNDMVHAPTVNIMRTPLGGRTFEGYGEDPWLTSRIGVAWIKGAQGEGVIANVKHYAAN